MFSSGGGATGKGGAHTWTLSWGRTMPHFKTCSVKNILHFADCLTWWQNRVFWSFVFEQAMFIDTVYVRFFVKFTWRKCFHFYMFCFLICEQTFKKFIRTVLSPYIWMYILSPLIHLQVPSAWLSTVGDWVFSVAAAWTWNSLPVEVTSLNSLQTFKTKLKSHLFLASFP